MLFPYSSPLAFLLKTLTINTKRKAAALFKDIPFNYFLMKNNAVIAYLKDSVSELRKVTWPTKEQTLRLTIIVSVFSLIVAALFGVLDYVFGFGFTQLLDLI